MKLFSFLKKLPIVLKIILIGALLGSGYFGYTTFFAKKSSAVQYKTAVAAKGTLLVTVASSGSVSSVNAANVKTEASGVVKKVYKKDGDTVKAGDPIIELDLDLGAKQKADQAYASYQSAKNSFDAAKVKLYTLQVDLFSTWDEFKQLAETSKYSNADLSAKTDRRALPEFHESEKTWLAAEATFKNQQNVINQAQTSLNSAWLSYQQTSSIVYAPISGTVSGLSLQEGSVIASSLTSSSSDSTVTSTKVASVTTEGVPLVSVSLTEIDIPKITLGNKATVLIDAIPGKTFSGSVVSIDSVGVVSSGVTTYPTVIQLDADDPSILSNMAATVTIITTKKDDVLLVSTSAIQTQNGSSSVRVMQKGIPVSMAVEVGLSSDTQTEIIGGIAEGDTVVTGTVTNGSTTNTTSTSLFGIGNRSGGAQIRP